MVDTISKQKRSTVMSRIKSKNTQPEIIVRKLLHGAGFRYRLHNQKLPGKPDLVLKKYRLCIFVHGCFWHAHESCKLAHAPKSRIEYWQNKLNKNVYRDKQNITRLIDQGWRVAVVWECYTRYTADEEMKSSLTQAIEGSEEFYQFSSTN